jgi:hypothetical protein
MEITMKHTLAILLIAVVGCKTLPDIKPPVITIPPITIPTGGQPDKPDLGIPSIPDKPDNCGCSLDKPICDPPYSKEWLEANARSEEVGVEAEMKIISRFCVKHPSDGKVWFLASVGKQFVKRGVNGWGEYKCTTVNGYRYHVLGYQGYDPQGRDGVKNPLDLAGKYVITEARKE